MCTGCGKYKTKLEMKGIKKLKNKIKKNFKNGRNNMKIKNIFKRLLLLISVLILNLLVFLNAVNAADINSANVYNSGDCGSLIKYKGTTIKVSYIEYVDSGVSYPAYCMDVSKPGAEVAPYTVSIDRVINDVNLWRIVINGYPYKSIGELGVANKEEAFTATKHAIYCYIHGNDISRYEGIGDAGTRTVNAMYQILNNAANSGETKISNNISIKENANRFTLDEISKEYVSKTYSVTSGAPMQKYNITLTRGNAQDVGGIKVTDLNNQEKTEFNSGEQFKVLVHINDMKQEGEFDLKVESKVMTKPVLYGTAPNSSYQDYALTANMYENGVGQLKDMYQKNGTKIVIVKKDSDTEEFIEGVEFTLLDEEKNEIFTGLKTNSEGKIVIDNIFPGKYYVKENVAKQGYKIFEELIEVVVDLDEETTVMVYNNKEDERKIEVSKKETTKEIKRLPVTGN